MSKRKFPKEIVQKAKAITGKRARVVVDYILKHGSITTEDLERLGYKHPPRAIRDVVEQGMPLARYWTKNSEGRKIAGYRFGNFDEIRHDHLGGRKAFSKEFHERVCANFESKCGICQTTYESRYLQLDHRIPYEIAGDSKTRTVDEYMPLCGSCNRAKSWSCEHCPNWTVAKKPETCSSCYWASPENYEHVAERQIRRLALVWEGADVRDHSKLALAAAAEDAKMPEYVKKVLRQSLGDETKS